MSTKIVAIASILILLQVSLVSAQFNQGLDAGNQLFARGAELLDADKFAAARLVFDDFIRTYPKKEQIGQAKLLRTIAALRSGHEDGYNLSQELLLEDHLFEQNTLLSQELGQYYFSNGVYAEALPYLEVARKSNPSDENVFNLGYAYYKTGSAEKAQKQFLSLKDRNSDFGFSASYYSGMLAFQKEDLALAKTQMEKAAKDSRYTSDSNPVLAAVYYRSGDKSLLYDLAGKIKAGSDNNAEVFILAGEAKFDDKVYADAIDYYEKGLRLRKSKDIGITYRLAFSNMEQDQYEQAIEYFKVAALEKNKLGQHASYYLGELYQQQANLANAARSFYSASRMDFDAALQLDALFQYGKVSYESGDFQEAIAAFQDFTAKYSDSEKTEEANELISKAFLQTSNYDLAISYMEKIKTKSISIKETYQRVTFLKGNELFNQSRFSEAIGYFNKSIQFPVDREIEDAAYYWKGEAYSIGKVYDKAIAAYKMVITAGARTEFDYKTQYSLGYAYYNQKQYAEAIPHFLRYINQTTKYQVNSMTLIDANLRLADAYYAEKQFNNAVTAYQKVVQTSFPLRDYALYQSGMASFLKGDYSASLTSFNSLIGKFQESTYVDDAVFQRAQIAFETTKYQVAIERFTDLIARFETSILVPYAYVRRALANFNLKNYEDAQIDYAIVIKEFPSHPMANSAILGLQEVMNLSGNSDEFESYLAIYRSANPESTNLETVDFEAARSQYFNQNYGAAIESFTRFITEYQESSYLDDAYYYLADANFRQGNPQKALEAYQKITERPGSTYYVRALNRSASLALESKMPEKAIPLYRRLSVEGQSKRDLTDAFIGLTEAYFLTQQHDSAIFYANKVLEEGTGAYNVQSKAHLFLGKSAFAMKDYDSAMDQFINTVNASRDQSGAEAQYMMARIFFVQKNYKQSIQTLYNLNKNFAAYEHWLGKSFLLLADNFVATDELFQAEATLNSLLEKSPLEAIRQEASKKLAALEARKKDQVQDTVKTKTDSIK